MSSEPIVSRFTDAIEKVVGDFCGQELTTAEALGALYLVMAKIARDVHEREEDDSEAIP